MNASTLAFLRSLARIGCKWAIHVLAEVADEYSKERE